MTGPASNNLEREAAAADWIRCLQEAALSEQDITEWISWCEADPLNRQAFERIEEVWTIAGTIDPERLRNRRPSMLSSRAAKWVLAASIVALMIFGTLGSTRERLYFPSISSKLLPPVEVQAGTDARLETEIGGQAIARLEDKSEADLGAHSALTVRYTDQSRLIIEDQGEAYFRVQKNAARPFVVQAGAVTATAIGTAFDVTREKDSVAIAVTEGVVEVRVTPAQPASDAPTQASIMHVGAGQRVLFYQGKLVHEAQAVDPAAVTSWREGRLDFRNEPLRLAVARLNRYADREIVVTDSTIDDLRVSGTAYVDRIDAWLIGIEAVLPVKVEATDDHHILISPAGSGFFAFRTFRQ